MTFTKSIIVGAGVYVGWNIADTIFYAIRGDRVAKKFVRKVRKTLNIKEDKKTSKSGNIIGFRAD